MSYITHRFYSVVCDHPGCGAKLEDYADDSWFRDEGDADEDCVEYYGWQTVDDETPTRHYCPVHHHAKCSKCGVEKTGARLELEDEGWDCPEYRYMSLCPDCSNRETVQ